MKFLFKKSFSLREMDSNSFDKFGHVEQSEYVGQGQEMTLVLRMRCHNVRLSRKVFRSLKNGAKCSG